MFSLFVITFALLFNASIICSVEIALDASKNTLTVKRPNLVKLVDGYQKDVEKKMTKAIPTDIKQLMKSFSYLPTVIEVGDAVHSITEGEWPPQYYFIKPTADDKIEWRLDFTDAFLNIHTTLVVETKEQFAARVETGNFMVRKNNGVRFKIEPDIKFTETWGSWIYRKGLDGLSAVGSLAANGVWSIKKAVIGAKVIEDENLYDQYSQPLQGERRHDKHHHYRKKAANRLLQREKIHRKHRYNY